MKTYQIITNMSCNLRCTYCYEHLSTKKNDIKSIRSYLTAAMKQDSGKEEDLMIDFIGGEPFFVPDLLDDVMSFALEHYQSYGFKKVFFNFSTNGTLLYRKKQKALLHKYKKHMYIGVSLDGDKEKHDKHRLTIDGKGSFDDAMRGYETAFDILGACRMNIKATFTKDSIHDYSRCVKYLLSLDRVPREIQANFNFEENFDEYDGILIANELIECLKYYLTLPKEKRPELTQICNRDVFFSSVENSTRKKARPLSQNRCGSCSGMSSLGFDGKVYGCNRFLSMDRPGMDIGVVKDDEILLHQKSIKTEVVNAYQTIPYSCQHCIFNETCSDCVAVAYDEGLSFKEYYNQRRMCGYTKAKEIARVYGRRLKNYQDKAVCC